MLQIHPIRYTPKTLSSAQRTSRRLRKSYMKRLRSKEYLRLKNIIPTVAKKRKVDKVTVVEEAIRYIDHLHEVLSQKLQQIGYVSQGTDQSAIFDMVKLMASGNLPSFPTPPAPLMTSRGQNMCKPSKSVSPRKS